MKVRYMMATVANHKLGDISRDEPDLCAVERETKNDYIGHWVTGFGFVEVRFPKRTTRDLTAEEISYFDGKGVAINGEVRGVLHVGIGGRR